MFVSGTIRSLGKKVIVTNPLSYYTIELIMAINILIALAQADGGIVLRLLEISLK